MDMLKYSNIYMTAMKRLKAWSGFASLESIMHDLPEMKVYLAGGALRDLILGQKECKDFDFFLSVNCFDSAIDRLMHYGRIENGPFGSPRWFPSGTEEKYCDLIAIERFYNGLWRCEDIIDVLNQFDFTANSVALSLHTGEFFDPVNGVRDIHRRVLRAVRFDYPDEPFMPGQGLSRLQVLWLRLVHYSVKLHLTIDPVTLRWLREHDDYAAGAYEFSKIFFPLHPGVLGTLNDSDL